MILFGHPTGNPNSHQAALAHYEAGHLAAFCLPWMPTSAQLRILRQLPGMKTWVARLERRCFSPLLEAPRIEGKLDEFSRMMKRILFPRQADERLAYQANDWLMRTMSRECVRPEITAVHSYEDCSLWQFETAKRLGKACIYDMPIGFYPAWEQTQQQLAREFSDWLPPGGLSSARYVRPDQKRKEMELADLILAPSSFVQHTIQQFTDKQVAFAPYGVDLENWFPDNQTRTTDTLKFIYAGQCSLRKGIPILLQAWRNAQLKDARLELVGSWLFAEEKKRELPTNVHFTGPVSRSVLRQRYQASDVFIFPSYFEGFGLVLLEAMACGLPAIASDATAGPDILDHQTGRVVSVGNVEELVESLHWFSDHRDQLPMMRNAARAKSKTFTWENYRRCVQQAVAPFAN